MAGKLEWDPSAFRGELRGRLLGALRDCGRLVARRAREKAPVDTGGLAASIHEEVDERKLTCRVYADAPYAINVEYDTSDTHEQPFLRPALFESEGEINRRLRRALE